MNRISSALIIIMLTMASSARPMTFEALTDSVLAVRQAQFEAAGDMSFDAVLNEKETDGKGKVKKLEKYDKKIRVKKFGDSLLIKEEYLSYYIDDEKQSDRELAKKVQKKTDEKKKRRGRDLAYDLTEPLQLKNRQSYETFYDGIADSLIDGFVCHKLRAEARQDIDTLIDALYYIDTASYHPVRIDFRPAKLVKKLMFRLSDFKMTLQYKPFNDKIWLPYHFEIKGKGRAALFVSVNFEAEETYFNPVINSGLADSLFLQTK